MINALSGWTKRDGGRQYRRVFYRFRLMIVLTTPDRPGFGLAPFESRWQFYLVDRKTAVLTAFDEGYGTPDGAAAAAMTRARMLR